MARKLRSESSGETTRPMRPALTPEARENQLISLATDLVEKRLREGTASSQEVTHFLKLASDKAKYEKEILKRQAELITAKTETLKSQKRTEELYQEAINAMKNYAGYGDQDDE